MNDGWNGSNASFPDNQATWGGSSAGQMAFPMPSQDNFGGSGVRQNDWGGSFPGQMAFPMPSQDGFGGSGVWGGSSAGQMAFPPLEQQEFPQPPDGGSDNSFWSQNMATRSAQRNGPPSLLPVPYQEEGNGQALSVLPTSFPTIGPGVQQVNPLVPALPDTEQEAPVYVAPMYTKPRPIIPRYRAISGLLSVIIVFALLCTGAGYWAQTTGKLTFFEKLFGTYAPQPIATNQQHMLQVPSNQVIQGPAANIVYSVGISNRVDPKTGIVPILVNQFTVGQTIWLVCSANPPQDGKLSVQWFSNGIHYQQFTTTIHGKKQQTATIPVVYGLPAEGKAEVYWNDQLAATVLFVVQPAAA
jgi:hypothetical protein